jgi:hypothetical protein
VSTAISQTHQERRGLCGRHRRPPAVVGSAFVLALAFVVTVSTAGCTNSGSQQTRPSRADQTEVTSSIKSAVTEISGVSRADVTYSPGATLAASRVDVGASVTPGKALDPVVGEIIRIVWTSSLTPVQLINIRIFHDEADDAQYTTVSFTDPATTKDLTARYGARPTATAHS